jgi:regulator of sigma D
MPLNTTNSSSTSNIEHLIKQWLTLRQMVLVQYTALCSSTNTTPQRLQIFCQDLMDYISLGHLKMFEKLAEHHAAQQSDSNGLNQTILLKINMTTNTVLNFNDKYTEPKNLNGLSADLSHVGEAFADRISFENTLINTALAPAPAPRRKYR